MVYLKPYTLLLSIILFLSAFRSCFTKNKPANLIVTTEKIPDKILGLDNDKLKLNNDKALGLNNDKALGLNNDKALGLNNDKALGLDNDKALGLEHKTQKEGHRAMDKPTDLLSESELPTDEGNNVKVDFDFEITIYALRKAADGKRGIRWIVSGEDNLIREAIDIEDVMKRSVDNKLYTVEDYAVQVLNIYRAARKTCDLYEEDGSVFSRMADKFMEFLRDKETEETEAFWIQKVKEINRRVVLTLSALVFPDKEEDWINTNLRLAENYVGLDDPHYNVTTTFKVDGKKFGLEDKKWLKLTEKQKLAFKNRQSAEWYTRLDTFEQKFIDAYLDKFLDGNHYIPTQIRNVPGCRNAYEKSILAYNENDQPITLGRYYHSATLVSPTQKEDVTIPQDNWEQIQQYVKDIELISLNHNVAFTQLLQLREKYGEKYIVEGTKDIVGDEKFIYIPINGIGGLTTPFFKPQVNRLIQESIAFYQDKYPSLCESFALNRAPEMKAQISAIKDPQDKVYFTKLNLLKKAAQNSDGINTFIQNFEKQNSNYYAGIGADYIACKSVLGQATSTSPVLFSCKSGKDRTGYMSSLVDQNIICMKSPSLQEGDVYRTLAYASHQQFLASVNGGMSGRFGMKPVKKDADTSYLRRQLFPKAASSTVIGLH